MEYFYREYNNLPDVDNRGWGNGYVVIPEGHKLYNIDLAQINDNVEIHGTITLRVLASELDWPEITEDMKDSIILGFDTAHGVETIKLWPKERVINETLKMQHQLIKYAETL